MMENGIKFRPVKPRSPHLNGKTPLERYCELIWDTPYWVDVYKAYESGVERFQERDYRLDLQLRKVKGSL